MSLSWEKEQAEPLDQVTLSVSVAEPGSLVGILVVDKASLDSDRSNDFTEKKVWVYSHDTEYTFTVHDNYNEPLQRQRWGCGFIRVIALTYSGFYTRRRTLVNPHPRGVLT